MARQFWRYQTVFCIHWGNSGTNLLQMAFSHFMSYYLWQQGFSNDPYFSPLSYCVTIGCFSARSRRTDESFDMCLFEDDPEPLGSSIRSTAMKILLGLSISMSAFMNIHWLHNYILNVLEIDLSDFCKWSEIISLVLGMKTSSDISFTTSNKIIFYVINV